MEKAEKRRLYFYIVWVLVFWKMTIFDCRWLDQTQRSCARLIYNSFPHRFTGPLLSQTFCVIVSFKIIMLKLSCMVRLVRIRMYGTLSPPYFFHIRHIFFTNNNVVYACFLFFATVSHDFFLSLIANLIFLSKILIFKIFLIAYQLPTYIMS